SLRNSMGLGCPSATTAASSTVPGASIRRVRSSSSKSESVAIAALPVVSGVVRHQTYRSPSPPPPRRAGKPTRATEAALTHGDRVAEQRPDAARAAFRGSRDRRASAQALDDSAPVRRQSSYTPSTL